jgi:hypothetical protein
MVLSIGTDRIRGLSAWVQLRDQENRHVERHLRGAKKSFKQESVAAGSLIDGIRELLDHDIITHVGYREASCEPLILDWDDFRLGAGNDSQLQRDLQHRVDEVTLRSMV